MKVYFNSNLDAPLESVKRLGEGEVITAILRERKDGILRDFRCNRCGKLFFQHESEIVIIGEELDAPLEKAPLNHLCGRCKTGYRILW